jgi:hypothetical protein
MKKNNTNEIVDLTLVKAFTEQHLEIHEKHNNKDLRADIYGDDFPYGECMGTRLVPIDDVKWRGGHHQTYITRYRGGNPAFKDINNSIRQGFKLKLPGIMLERKSDGYYCLTGHTRYRIFEDMGVQNIIATVFEIPNPSDASLFALKLNPKQDPSGPMTLRDVEQECSNALNNGWIKPKSDYYTDVINAIGERFNDICGGYFTKGARESAIIRVYNAINQGDIISWETQTQLADWMSDNKYINTNEVMYLVASASSVSKTITRAAKLAVENIGKEIRVVIHTGTLDSGNLKESYDSRVESFLSTWQSDMENIRATFFGVSNEKGCNIKHQVSLANNIVLYGTLPALNRYHNLKKINLFKKSPTIA